VIRFCIPLGYHILRLSRGKEVPMYTSRMSGEAGQQGLAETRLGADAGFV